ncbi:hypothetical protein FSARC_1844 [Fusarium sarcochroum]|uniref:2EXR domain-containing protein n=1 Tax=Fusarium sarcochroum TaxID=1208366 RepID=A0A8H4U843_9HYPO|nr:hypothetical protein FSARC_1844 [Fusarium sarcochroum]
MAPDTFPQFLSLPREIQLLIWEAAVRPVPGNRHVHRFYLAPYRLKGPHQFRPIQGRFVQLLPTRNGIHFFGNTYYGGVHAAVPLDDPDGNPNDSVYLTDSSLWTVCKDSRQAMERRFTKNEWWSRVKTPYHPKRTATHGQYFGQEGATHTASFIEDDGVFKHITIDPVQDLIHLDPRHSDKIDWWTYYDRGDFLPLLDIVIRDETSPEARPSFFGPNLAFDYDRSMLDTFNRRRKHYRQAHFQMWSGLFMDMLTEIFNSRQRMWFIDYELVRIDHAPIHDAESSEAHGETRPQNEEQSQTAEDSREVFRSGDCIYTEVKRQDIGVRWEITKNDVAYDGDNGTAFDWIDHLTYERGEDPNRFRVLARQPVPGRPLPPRTPWSNRCHGNPTCEDCGFKEVVPRVRPSTLDKERIESLNSSMSSLNLFDSD